MGKGRIMAGLMGAGVALAIGNSVHPGSAGETATAASDAAVQVVHGVAAPVDQVVVESGPLVHDLMGSFQQSGVGNALQGAANGGGLPPAQQAAPGAAR